MVRICTVNDLDATGAKGVTICTDRGALNLIVVKDGDNYRAYQNNCPHLRMPLEILADHFLDETRELIVCRTHGARFSVSDGYCISGPCRASWLKAVLIRVTDGDIWLADAAEQA